MKYCKECNDPLPKQKSKFCCKACQDTSTNRNRRERRATNAKWREKENARRRKRYADSPELREKNGQHTKKYRKDHRESFKATRRIYDRRRRSTPEGKLKNTISCSVRNAARSEMIAKDARTEEILGISIPEFKKWIKGQFTEGMSWDNHGRESVKKGEPFWELDHIVAQTFADLGKDKEEKKKFLYLLNHYTNFRPLWREHPDIPAHLLNGNKDGGKGAKLILDLVSPENKIKYKEIIERAQQRSW